MALSSPTRPTPGSPPSPDFFVRSWRGRWDGEEGFASLYFTGSGSLWVDWVRWFFVFVPLLGIGGRNVSAKGFDSDGRGLRAVGDEGGAGGEGVAVIAAVELGVVHLVGLLGFYRGEEKGGDVGGFHGGCVGGWSSPLSLLLFTYLLSSPSAAFESDELIQNDDELEGVHRSLPDLDSLNPNPNPSLSPPIRREPDLESSSSSFSSESKSIQFSLEHSLPGDGDGFSPAGTFTARLIPGALAAREKSSISLMSKEEKPMPPILGQESTMNYSLRDIKKLTSRVWHQDEFLNKKRRWLMGLPAGSMLDGSKKKSKMPKFLSDE
ncbi:uncharacterized protein A4U43_C07F23420 [Asparagus officinalis]|uniref:Uncharacterized protein n=1 Tax=Asparagus officinalis TaxID=4686 RepID=A0A5P1EEG3_ASPOF|nr:uncharacterized protein A4U43_C07F23420 [Asparagus officinalis]